MAQRRDISSGDRRDLTSSDRRDIGANDRRDLAADRTDRQFWGDLPDYITNNFADVSNVIYWAAHRKLLDKNWSDNDGVDTLPDFSGGNHAGQDTAGDQPIYRTDHIEFTGGEHIDLQDVSGSYDQWTIFGLADRDAATSNSHAYYGIAGGTSEITIRSNSQDDLRLVSQDEDGNGNAEGGFSGMEVMDRFAFVASVDFSADTTRIIAEDESGTRETSESTSVGFTSNLQPSPGDHLLGDRAFNNGIQWDGKGEVIGVANTVLSNTDEDSLLTDLISKEM